MARRLEEILCAHGGVDPLDEAILLAVAKMEHEAQRQERTGFLAPELGQAPEARLASLLEAAERRWPGIVEPGARSELRGLALERVAEVLREVRLDGEGLAGLDAIFEGLAHKERKSDRGQYFTPRYVAREIAAMLEPVRGESVIDPACGSAGLLAQAVARSPSCEAWGADVDARAVKIARVVMAASGQPASRVLCCDALLRSPSSSARTAPIEDQVARARGAFAGFDVVIANPPFAGDLGEAHRGDYELARGPRVERDVLFLERTVSLLRPGGRFGIVLPHNKLGGRSFVQLRAWLLEHVRVVAVLGLGRNTFLPHTSQKTCVLFGIKRARPGECASRDEILLALSERDGKDARGRLALRRDGRGIDHDLGELVEPVREHFARALEELHR